MSKSRDPSRFLLTLIVLAYATLVVLYAVNVPRWNAPDEPAHFNYVRHIAERFGLPVLTAGDYDFDYLERLKAARFPPHMDVASLRYESHQPPLYYLLAAPFLLAASPLGVDAQVLVVRLFSALLGLLLLIVAFATIRRIAPDDQLLAFGATALLAFTPMLLAVNASAGNDPLANLTLALVAYESVGIAAKTRFRGELKAYDWANIRLGVWLGLALLTKVTAYVGIFVALVALLISVRRRPAAFPGRALLCGAIALAISGWWFVRNAVVYGIDDPFGLRRHAAVVQGQPVGGALGPQQALEFAATTFRSFWGQFGWMGVLLDDRVYAVLALYSLAALLGLALVAISMLRRGRIRDSLVHPASLLPLTFALVAVAMLLYSVSSFYQPQGRYLFAAFFAIAVGFVFGLRQLVAPRLAPAVVASFALGLVALDVFALYLYIVPALRI